MGRNAETHIRVTEETWEQLNRKKGPGDSFEDVITELLNSEENVDEIDGMDDIVARVSTENTSDDSDDSQHRAELPETPDVGDVIDHPTMGRVRVVGFAGDHIEVEEVSDGSDAEEPDFGLKHEEPDVHDDRDPQPAGARLGACRGDNDDVSVLDTGTVTVGLAAKISKGDVFEGDDFRAVVEGVNKSFIDIRLLHHQDDPELQRVDDISVLDVLSAEYELNERSISDPPAAEVE